MRILFKFATRSRPQLFERGIKSIIDNCISDDYIILVSYDNDDHTMKNVRESHYKNTVLSAGTSLNKIHAINRDVSAMPEWDILVNMSDDMLFTKKGFDEIIRNNFALDLSMEMGMTYKAKYNLDQCLHFPDGNRNDLITMSIMGREYYERTSYIYNPEYKSLYCDNEQTDVAMLLGKYKYVNEDIVRHLHPAYGKAAMDAQYVHTESLGGEDKVTYEKRKLKNFDL
tara:strand:+ start:666 stop:1346 length:681 start_codon:yes stop_codon:yes gene_type:complete